MKDRVGIDLQLMFKETVDNETRFVGSDHAVWWNRRAAILILLTFFNQRNIFLPTM
jgi:hypothetical protein